jgi:hypothetical protein
VDQSNLVKDSRAKKIQQFKRENAFRQIFTALKLPLFSRLLMQLYALSVARSPFKPV